MHIVGTLTLTYFLYRDHLKAKVCTVIINDWPPREGSPPAASRILVLSAWFGAKASWFASK